MRRAAALGLLAAALGGCGGGTPATSSGASSATAVATTARGGACAPSGGAVAVCYTVAITGAAPLAGATALPVPGTTTCAALAQARPFRLPAFPPELDGGGTLSIDLLVLRSTGPGTYRDAAITGQGGPMVLFLRHEPWSTFGGESSVVATVAPDGSGRLDFTGLVRTSDSTLAPPHPTVAGSISWRCVEP